MGEPITVGGGGGLIDRLPFADYNVDLEVDETKYTPDGDGNFIYSGHKIASLKILDFGGTLIADLTNLLPDDGECEIVLKFNHGYERIYVRSKPIRVSFDPDVWESANGKRSRQTRHDRVTVDLGLRGRWRGLEIATPRGGFKVKIESD